jgi:hypothetical protein
MATKKIVEQEEVVAEPKAEKKAAFVSPSPVDNGTLYTESHPILGVTRRATVVSQSDGDGHVGDGAEIVRE